MLYLLLAILSSSLISIIMRLSTGRTKSERGMLLSNYFVCSLVAALYSGADALFPFNGGFPRDLGHALALGFVGGFLFLAAFILFQNNVKKNGVVLSSSFMKLGLLVPIMLSIAVFHETPRWFEIVGFILALFAIVLINYQPGEGKASSAWGLILLLLVGGAADSMTKIFEETGEAALSSQFLFYIFLSAFILCLIMLIIEKNMPSKMDLLFGALIGIPNYFSSRFILKALADLNAVMVYPVYSVCTILVVTIVGIIAFKERLKKQQWLGLAVIIVSLALLNLNAGV